MKRARPEHKLQCEVIAYWAMYGRPDLKCFAVANGELRHPTVAMRLKAEGVRPGVADLCVLLDGGRTGWMELKAPRGSLSDEQKGFAASVQRLGHHWACIRSVQDAAYAFSQWGALRQREVA